jgi:RES domain
VELIAGATVLRGDFFRSVAFRYFHPDDVISGEGTRSSGGRFVPLGVRAVYASLAEETALREVTTRKNALGGRSQIAVGEYPRMTYVISVTTNRNLDLASPLPSELADVVGVCSRGPGIRLRRSWLRSGFRRVSKVSFFRLRQAPAAMSRYTWRTLQLAVSSFAIATKF